MCKVLIYTDDYLKRQNNIDRLIEPRQHFRCFISATKKKRTETNKKKKAGSIKSGWYKKTEGGINR